MLSSNGIIVGGIILAKNNNNSKKITCNISEVWGKYNLKWVIMVSIWTFILTIIISIVSEIILINSTVIIAFIILIAIMLMGVVSDIIGIAVTVASEKPFHAMAADRVESARYAIKLLKNAGSVSNFCNDVIGDICGIVSGAATISIVLQLNNIFITVNRTALTIIMSGVVASLTVGGKAIGKSIAMKYSHNIVFRTAKGLKFFEEKLNLNLFSKPEKKNRK